MTGWAMRAVHALISAAFLLSFGSITGALAFGSTARPLVPAAVVMVQECSECGSFGGEPSTPRGDVTGSISSPGDSPTGPTGGGEGAGSPSGDPVASVRRDFLTIKTASLRLEKDIETCDDIGANALRDCVARALDAYADRLAKAGTLLPPDTSPVADIIAKGADKVRRARSKREIVAAVRQVVADVRKSIELIVADDPIVASLSTRASNTIVSSLERTDRHLESAVGL